MMNRSPVSHARIGAAPARPAPLKHSGWLARVRDSFFKTRTSAFITVALLVLLYLTLPRLIDWAIVQAVWYFPGAQACKETTGACWAVIPEKYRVMLFGTFPYDEQWRGMLVVIIVLALAVYSAAARPAMKTLVVLWLAATAVVFTLMLGGLFGLEPVGTHEWGGLPLTLIMFVGTVVGGIPLGVLLALGRRSHMPAIRAVCVGIIEVVRGLPLVTVLFMASLMIPLFMPQGITVDKFLRAQIAMTIFFSAYAAEVFRGGLQAIGNGQYEAADTVGLTYWQKMAYVIMPQVGRIVLPSMMNEIIRAFKNTTFIGIIGMFDVLRATSTAIQDPVWVRYSIEAYLFIAFLYFIMCYAMSRYSMKIEQEITIKR
jgi:general L-amino acid transport system permease protein